MRLADNIVHFSRILRRAGLAVGPDRVLAAIAAVEAVGVQRRDDVHAALSAVMLDRHDQQVVFDEAFDAFWRDPRFLEQLMRERSSGVASHRETPQPAPSRRLADALATRPGPDDGAGPPPAPADGRRREACMSFSARERLQHADFESMTSAEYALARRLAERMPPPVDPVRVRRRRTAPRGHIDLRRTLQRLARQPHTLVPLFSRPAHEIPPLVVLLDISGSMERYARIVLHYVHGLMRRHRRVHAFTFGTRLSHITRCLRDRDPDVALRKADAAVQDWKGGTRIAGSLNEFNRRWSRRVLTGNAAVLLVTDGLDRDEHGSLSAAAARLARAAHQLVWLNPLLRYDGFQPRAAGVRALLPHVDRFLPVHNLASLADLGRALRLPAARPSTLLH